MTSWGPDTRHWTEAFLGVGYVWGGRGPEAYDCWSFFRWVQREHFGRHLPEQAAPPSLSAVAKALAAGAAELGWQAVEVPQDGDAVFLSALKRTTHIGVWVGDLRAVLHCPEGGAVLHDAAHLKIAAWRLRGYLRPMVT